MLNLIIAIKKKKKKKNAGENRGEMVRSLVTTDKMTTLQSVVLVT